MKFDFAIGNPPYQEEQNGRMLPVYHQFMDEVYKVCDAAELITPGRFLFNAGQTGSDWNKKMLSDTHFKVLNYEPDSKRVFSGVDIKGGVAITFHDNRKEFGAITFFVANEDLRSILSKVINHHTFIPLTEVVFTSTKYALANIYEEHPDYSKYVKSEGKHSQIDSNAFGKMPIFVKEHENDEDYVRLLGREDNRRAYRWVKRKYMADPGNMDYYKVFVPQVNGTGAFEALSSPIIGEPGVGSTQTFISIGKESVIENAENILKYLKGKFSRALLGTLKITHHNPPDTWKNVPLQDFSNNSDIVWSASVKNIDRQLYKKYGLSQEEIDFIESNVKEME